MVLAGGVLALGLFIAVETAMLEVAPSQAAVGPRLFPSLVAAGLLLVGVALLREAFFGHIAHEGGFELDWPAVGLVSAGLVLQMLILEWVGWIVAAVLLFMLTARAFGSRRLLLDLAIGLGLGVLTFAVFSYGLDLSLPAGELAERLLLPAEGESP
jgi:putative tricarboxylic transport membrane protein